jgi:pyruvate/2-oxoglutarate dehydrogenase complex dihydrolipoamide dehydrogenase (E3) component
VRTDYDLIVIGGGAGGLTAAGMAALLGAKTALIEQDRLGGECTWTGCIPSKYLLHAASVAQTIRTAEQYGFEPVVPRITFPGVVARMQALQQQIYEDADAPPNMEKLGVEVVKGTAAFLDPHVLSVNGRSLRSRYFVIATGSSPRVPNGNAPVLTNETIFRLTAQPRHLLVIGGGPMGVEMAQAFRRLGSQITVIVAGNEILPRDDEELAAMLRCRLESEGIRFVRQTRVTDTDAQGPSIIVKLSNGEIFECDVVLAAMGREVQTGPLRLDLAGVRADRNGIAVDKRSRTSVRHIYAVGDATGRYQLTHMAEHMAKVAITNCILHWPASIDERYVPWCTFTSPELAHCGHNERDVDPHTISVLRFPFRKTDRAIIEGETDGMVKLIADRRGRVLGASVLGKCAGELVNMWSFVMGKGLRVSDISTTIHPYPTYALANRRAADRWDERKLNSPLLALLGSMFGYRGVRRGSGVL